MNARGRKQVERELQQDARTKQQDARMKLQDARMRQQDERANQQAERANQQDERANQQADLTKQQAERTKQQDERERGQDQRDVMVKEREHLRDLFVSVLGHDVRTPLSTIRLAAATMRDRGALSDVDARALQRIERAARRMEVLASELLDLARARLGGGFPIQRTTIDVVALVRGILEEFRAQHADRPVTCEAPASAEGSFDPSKVAQVISNLLRNAFEYAAAGTPISVILLEGPDSISIEVANAGEIPAAERESLFDGLRRGRQASRHGLGLGLYIAKEIATAHGGDLSFTSTEGETRFTLRLPRALTHAS